MGITFHRNAATGNSQSGQAVKKILDTQADPYAIRILLDILCDTPPQEWQARLKELRAQWQKYDYIETLSASSTLEYLIADNIAKRGE